MSTLRVEALEQPDGTAFVFNNKNLLINGGMNVWQRSTSVPSFSTSGYQTADRWRIGAVGGTAIGTWTLSRSTDVPSAQGFGYSFKMDCTTANASPSASSNTTIQQRIEGQNLQHLLKGTSSAKAITLSFWIKSNKTGTYIIELIDQDNSRHICQSYTIDTASTWEKKTLTFEGDTSGVLDNDNAESLRVNWWIASGSDYTSGTLATSWASSVNANRAVGQVNLADSTSNELYITGCQMEIGEAATDFQFEPYESTYLKCLRYNYRLENTVGAPFVFVAVGVVNSSTSSFGQVTMVHPLRDTPSVSYSSLSHFDIERRDVTPTAIFLLTASTNLSPGLQWNHASITVGEASVLTLDSVGWINFDAEL